MGLGVIGGLICALSADAAEEHFKNKNLKKIDDAYKVKITNMKRYFLNNNPQALLSYSNSVAQLPNNLKLKFK